MFKKIFTAAAVAGLLVLGGGSAAQALYNGEDEPTVGVSAPTITAGNSTVITVSNLEDVASVSFTANGGALSSIVLAAVGPVVKPVSNGSASVTFTATQPGNYTVWAADAVTGEPLGSVAVTVAAAGSGAGGTGGGTGGTGGGLPATGNELPAAALWLGVGALGIGGIAIAAGVARRRAHTSN